MGRLRRSGNLPIQTTLRTKSPYISTQYSSEKVRGQHRSMAFAPSSKYLASLISFFIACSWAAKLSVCQIHRIRNGFPCPEGICTFTSIPVLLFTYDAISCAHPSAAGSLEPLTSAVLIIVIMMSPYPGSKYRRSVSRSDSIERQRQGTPLSHSGVDSGHRHSKDEMLTFIAWRVVLSYPAK